MGSEAARDWSKSMNEQGMSPSPETTELFRNWLREGGELGLEWDPAEDFQASENRLTLVQWQEKAGLSITYNDRSWGDIGFAVDPDKPDSDTAQQRLVPVEEPDTDPRFRSRTRKGRLRGLIAGCGLNLQMGGAWKASLWL